MVDFAVVVKFAISPLGDIAESSTSNLPLSKSLQGLRSGRSECNPDTCQNRSCRLSHKARNDDQSSIQRHEYLFLRWESNGIVGDIVNGIVDRAILDCFPTPVLHPPSPSVHRQTSWPAPVSSSLAPPPMYRFRSDGDSSVSQSEVDHEQWRRSFEVTLRHYGLAQFLFPDTLKKPSMTDSMTDTEVLIVGLSVHNHDESLTLFLEQFGGTQRKTSTPVPGTAVVVYDEWAQASKAQAESDMRYIGDENLPIRTFLNDKRVYVNDGKVYSVKGRRKPATLPAIIEHVEDVGMVKTDLNDKPLITNFPAEVGDQVHCTARNYKNWKFPRATLAFKLPRIFETNTKWAESFQFYFSSWTATVLSSVSPIPNVQHVDVYDGIDRSYGFYINPEELFHSIKAEKDGSAQMACKFYISLDTAKLSYDATLKEYHNEVKLVNSKSVDLFLLLQRFSEESGFDRTNAIISFHLGAYRSQDKWHGHIHIDPNEWLEQNEDPQTKAQRLMRNCFLRNVHFKTRTPRLGEGEETETMAMVPLQRDIISLHRSSDTFSLTAFEPRQMKQQYGLFCEDYGGVVMFEPFSGINYQCWRRRFIDGVDTGKTKEKPMTFQTLRYFDKDETDKTSVGYLCGDEAHHVLHMYKSRDEPLKKCCQWYVDDPKEDSCGVTHGVFRNVINGRSFLHNVVPQNNPSPKFSLKGRYNPEYFEMDKRNLEKLGFFPPEESHESEWTPSKPTTHLLNGDNVVHQLWCHPYLPLVAVEVNTEETCLSVVERAKLIEALYAYLLRVRAIELSSKHTLTGKFSWKQSTNQAAHLIFPLCGQRLECRGVNTDPFEQAEPFKLEWPANCFAYIKFDPPFFAENIHPKPKKWTAGYLKFGNIDYPS